MPTSQRVPRLKAATSIPVSYTHLDVYKRQVVCNAFINAGLPAFTGSYADWAQTLIYLCEMTFTIAMTVGSVKGAQTLTSKAFGL